MVEVAPFEYTQSDTVEVLAAASVQVPETSVEDATVEGDDEPQNSLTRKFTEDEWSGVRALREGLLDILAQAYPDREDQMVSVTLWGVSIDPAKTKDARVSVLLVKFLRARDLNVDEAKKMLIETLRWRKEFKIEEAMEEKFPEDTFAPLGRMYGRDKEGRPVVYNLYGANKDLDAVFGDVERFLRWRVAFMERSIELLDFENVDQMVQIHDYDGVSMMSRTPGQKAAASRASALFQNYYPELLFRKFFVNVPSLMAWIFWMFKPFISAKTLEKFSMVGTGPKTIGVVLLPVIEAKQLPKRYGGEADDLA
ncbi:CRAL/TRIO domain-containing protein [Laetiporus sulphureus 93-53]|uniref:Phosphatidylinositol transfer protein SFH5 n=1 Tax=Laetiporus sulphureus 93-53 TaxID=1314785 RepID=A0A165ENE9_9APHY|nr:CRAL/TRIO domain-containing protein [Laetiporus sulphureus 93-53]KZT07426.1 CRAL/TRIO domain-containing protein [Laetiporus sulphureus 93-53]